MVVTRLSIVPIVAASTRIHMEAVDRSGLRLGPLRQDRDEYLVQLDGSSYAYSITLSNYFLRFLYR